MWSTNEQRELVHSLEKEVADAALRYTAVIQATDFRLLQVLRFGKLTANLPPSQVLDQLAAVLASCQQDLHTCSAIFITKIGPDSN